MPCRESFCFTKTDKNLKPLNHSVPPMLLNKGNRKNQSMKTSPSNKKMPIVLTACGLLGLAGIAGAQPDLGAAKGDNPPNRTPGQMLRNMPQEQRRTLMQGRLMEQVQERRAETLRQSLTQGGFEEKALQDTVIEFANEQIKAALSLREKTSKVSDAVADKATTDTQISVILNDLHTAQADEKERRAASEKALDAKISYTQKPRLEALLTTLNLIGGESGSLVNIMGGMGRGGGLGGGGFARGGQNGFGGAQGGGAAGGAGGFGGGRRGFGGGFGANQNGDNAQGAGNFGLRRERRNTERQGNKENKDNKDEVDAGAKVAA